MTPEAAAKFGAALAQLRTLDDRGEVARRRTATQIASAVPADAEAAARLALAASIAAGNPISQRQLMERFGLTRTAERKVRQSVLAEANGHAPITDG